jgi:uncharacterized membrane protein
LNKVLVLGALLVVAGVALVAYGAAGQGNASAGGFILIGPFPIVFGTGSNGGELALLSVLLGALMVVLLLVMALRLWRTPSAR